MTSHELQTWFHLHGIRTLDKMIDKHYAVITEYFHHTEVKHRTQLVFLKLTALPASRNISFQDVIYQNYS